MITGFLLMVREQLKTWRRFSLPFGKSLKQNYVIIGRRKKNRLGVRVAVTLPVIAMIIKKFAKYAVLLLLSCTADYGIVTNITETVDPPPTEVVVDSLIQPTLPKVLMY